MNIELKIPENRFGRITLSAATDFVNPDSYPDTLSAFHCNVARNLESGQLSRHGVAIQCHAGASTRDRDSYHESAFYAMLPKQISEKYANSTIFNDLGKRSAI